MCGELCPPLKMGGRHTSDGLFMKPLILETPYCLSVRPCLPRVTVFKGCVCNCVVGGGLERLLLVVSAPFSSLCSSAIATPASSCQSNRKCTPRASSGQMEGGGAGLAARGPSCPTETASPLLVTSPNHALL